MRGYPHWRGVLSLWEPNGPKTWEKSRQSTLKFLLFFLTTLEIISHLVVIIQQPQSCCAVFIAIDAHHGLGGSRQRVLQVAPPRLILAVEHPSGGHRQLVWYQHHQPLTAEVNTKEETHSKGLKTGARCQAHRYASGFFSPTFS